MPKKGIILASLLLSAFLIASGCVQGPAPPVTEAELKACSADSDCTAVESIEGLTHIPAAGEQCGCECAAAINKNFLALWEQKSAEFIGKLPCGLLCKPCGLDTSNSRAACENGKCALKQAVAPAMEVSVSTDKPEYLPGEKIKIAIKNDSDRNVCLESCNTYLLEKKNGGWKALPGKQCFANFCTPFSGTEAFEVETVWDFGKYRLESGLYRVSVPVYINCASRDFSSCAGQKTFYSGELRIKEEDCGQLEARINATVEAANYCDTNSDCLIVENLGCPFGCYALVNKESDLSGARSAIVEYNGKCPTCFPSCTPSPKQEKIECKLGKCSEYLPYGQ